MQQISKVQTLLTQNKSKISKIIIGSIILLALVIGAVTRLYSVFSYDQFAGDQARDAFVYQKMGQGIWPTLGPGSSVGGYGLPPLYYYLNYFVSFGSLDPAWQAFPNALFSFLSIPLLFYFILLLLNGQKSPRAWLIASVAALWWSVFFNDIILNNLEWNPNSAPFFLMILVILIKSVSNPNLKIWQKVTLWIALGFVVSIMMSLHSSTLFVIPAVFVIFVGYYLFKNRSLKSSWLCLLSFATILLMHVGYLHGEFGRNFQNTATIFETIFKSSGNNYTFFQRFDRAIFNYLELGDLAYIFGKNVGNIAHFFLALVLGLAILKFKGNKTIWAFLWGIWLVFSYAASSYWGIFFIHYKILIWFAPIIFVSTYLYYCNYKDFKQLILAALVIVLSLQSINLNLSNSIKFIGGKFGKERVILTSDIYEVLKALPLQANFARPARTSCHTNT